MGVARVFRLTCIYLVLSLSLACSSVSAFSIKPEPTDQEGKIISRTSSRWHILLEWNARMYEAFTQPVHELYLHRVFECQHDSSLCSSPRKPHSFAPDAMIMGTRWNDMPLFQIESLSFFDCVGRTVWLPTDAKCWVNIFKNENADRPAIEGEPLNLASSIALMRRLHYKDMQFIHAMAASEQEKAATTRSNIVMWMELVYRLSIGEIDRGLELRKTGVPLAESLFADKPWSAQQLFTGDDSPYRKDPHFRHFMFGILMHTLLDSYCPSHAQRKPANGKRCSQLPDAAQPGKISNFYVYSLQDPKKHQTRDTMAALEAILDGSETDPIHVGRRIKNHYDAGRPWNEVRPYLECIFQLEDSEAPGTAGEEFGRDNTQLQRTEE